MDVKPVHRYAGQRRRRPKAGEWEGGGGLPAATPAEKRREIAALSNLELEQVGGPRVLVSCWCERAAPKPVPVAAVRAGVTWSCGLAGCWS